MRQAKVLRLLRHDARIWWWHAQLRKYGNHAEAIRLERESIRRVVRHFRKNLNREAITYRLSVISFEDRPQRKPFDLSPCYMDGSYTNGYTVSSSGVHPGEFAAWVYCYANRIGIKRTVKASDLV